MNELSHPKCSIVILNWNGTQETLTAVDSILKTNSKVSFEMIIIDQGSDTENVSNLKILSGNSKIKIFFLKKNLGFPGGVNYAISQAKGDFYVCINNDVEVKLGWLDYLYESISSNNSIGAACSNIIENGQEVVGNSRYLKHIHGGSMIISKVAWEIVGNFDSKNFNPIYGEELDWSYRARNIGFKLVKSKKSVVFHAAGITAERCLPKNKSLQYRIYHRVLFRFFNYKYNDWISLNTLRDLYHEIKNRHTWLYIKAHINYLFKINFILKERKIRLVKNNKGKELLALVNDFEKS